MRISQIDTDYLVIGAGAAGLAFVEVTTPCAMCCRLVKPTGKTALNTALKSSRCSRAGAPIGGHADQMQACAEATSLDDLYLRLEACGVLLHIDPTRTPTMFHLATITPAEAAELCRVKQVIRMGHVPTTRAPSSPTCGTGSSGGRTRRCGSGYAKDGSTDSAD